MILHAAEDAVGATEQLFTHARQIEDQLTAIREQVGIAWQEQTRSSKEYYGLIRGVLLVLDDLRALAANQSCMGDLVARSESLLHEQDITEIPVASGDSFCSDIHVCSKTEPASEVPPGRVISILAPGYHRRLPSGETAVVRPVQVAVSRSPVEPEEPKK